MLIVTPCGVVLLIDEGRREAIGRYEEDRIFLSAVYICVRLRLAARACGGVELMLLLLLLMMMMTRTIRMDGIDGMDGWVDGFW